MSASDVEDRFVAILEELQSMVVEASGARHEHLDALIDPASRRSPQTLHYLVSTASGTLQDRIFSLLNRDRLRTGTFEEFNDRYRALLTEAVTLAGQLALPAAGTAEQRAVVLKIAAASKKAH